VIELVPIVIWTAVALIQRGFIQTFTVNLDNDESVLDCQVRSPLEIIVQSMPQVEFKQKNLLGIFLSFLIFLVEVLLTLSDIYFPVAFNILRRQDKCLQWNTEDDLRRIYY
jgi:hypothetical protein